MAPKHDYVLIPRTWEYFTLPGKRDSADVIKVKELEMGRLSAWTKLNLMSR